MRRVAVFTALFLFAVVWAAPTVAETRALRTTVSVKRGAVAVRSGRADLVVTSSETVVADPQGRLYEQKRQRPRASAPMMTRLIVTRGMVKLGTGEIVRPSFQVVSGPKRGRLTILPVTPMDMQQVRRIFGIDLREQEGSSALAAVDAKTRLEVNATIDDAVDAIRSLRPESLRLVTVPEGRFGNRTFREYGEMIDKVRPSIASVNMNHVTYDMRKEAPDEVSTKFVAGMNLKHKLLPQIVKISAAGKLSLKKMSGDWKITRGDLAGYSVEPPILPAGVRGDAAEPEDTSLTPTSILAVTTSALPPSPQIKTTNKR